MLTYGIAKFVGNIWPCLSGSYVAGFAGNIHPWAGGFDGHYPDGHVAMPSILMIQGILLKDQGDFFLITYVSQPTLLMHRLTFPGIKS